MNIYPYITHPFTSIYIHLHPFTFIYIHLHSFTSIYIHLHSSTAPRLTSSYTWCSTLRGIAAPWFWSKRSRCRRCPRHRPRRPRRPLPEAPSFCNAEELRRMGDSFNCRIHDPPHDYHIGPHMIYLYISIYIYICIYLYISVYICIYLFFVYDSICIHIDHIDHESIIQI